MQRPCDGAELGFLTELKAIIMAGVWRVKVSAGPGTVWWTEELKGL